VFHHGTIGGATILLRRIGWREGSTVVSILATAFLYIKGTVSKNPPDGSVTIPGFFTLKDLYLIRIIF
jgi:hypothetical protein